METCTVRQSTIGRWIVVAVYGIALSTLPSVTAYAQSTRIECNVKQAMVLLKQKTAKLGVPGIKGEDAVAGKSVPALYFGTTQMDNNFTVVDEVKKEVGGTATLFVKDGDDFVRVATNVQKADGSRALGTRLDPNGKAITAVRGGASYSGDADVLGTVYVTRYEPIYDSAHKVIGIYYVGYLK